MHINEAGMSAVSVLTANHYYNNNYAPVRLDLPQAIEEVQIMQGLCEFG